MFPAGSLNQAMSGTVSTHHSFFVRFDVGRVIDFKARDAFR